MSGRHFSEKLTTVAQSARQVKFEHDSFSQLAGYLEKLVPIALELQQGSKHDDLVQVLEKDLESATDLISLCNNKSQMYLLTHCRSVVRQLESVTHDMGKSLELVPVASLPGTDETKKMVGNLSQEMQRIRFQVKESEDRICRALERETSSIRSDLALQNSLLVDIARTVGVEDFSNNPHALKNHIDLLKKDIQGPDDLHMSNLIAVMFDNVVKRHHGRSSGNYHESRQRRRYEDPYEAFLCPLTGRVMSDPVTIVETGKTYERKAIEAFFANCQDNKKPAICPQTSKKLQSLDLKASIAIRNAIEEWHARNESTRIENAVPMLDAGSPEADMIEAMEDIQELCRRNRHIKAKVRNEGLIPILVDRLKNGEEVRCKALQTLRVLAEDDDDIKEAIGQTTAVWSAVKCLSRELSREREEAVSLLLELSKSYTLCEKIGASSGAILILVGMTSSKSENVLSAQRADDTLNNLEMCDANVRQMAENGRLKPLITRLLEGPDELRIQMASYIADIALNSEGKERLAESGSNVLIEMLESNKAGYREVSLKALRALSTLDSNGCLLIKAGILPPLLRDLFMSGISQVPKLKEVAATVLANVVNSCTDWEDVAVDNEGNTLTSEQYVHNLLLLISNTGPAIGAKLLQVLLGLASSPRGVSDVVSHIKSAGALVTLIQFLEAQQKELLVTSVRLLSCLSPYMGQDLADGLRITTRQLGTLVKLLGQSGVNVEMAAAAGLLANLPVTDYNLTRALMEEGVVSILLSRINDLKRGVVRIGAGKYVGPFQSGLVTILARFTYDLDDPDMLNIATDNNLCTLFTSLLQTVSLDEVQRWSAIALENMSMKSKHLSEVPEPPAQAGGWFSCFKKPSRQPAAGLCPVHSGRCSAKSTFCLVEAGAVDPLVACLEHRDTDIVEATLQALSTLIQEPCDVERGVQVLSNAGAIPPVMAILQEHRTEGLRERSVWILERVLRSAEAAQTIAGSGDVHSSLVDAFRHGNYRSRQLAEKSLKHLNRIPNFSGVFQPVGRR
ncbi:U-box domain-containing protein 43 [Selaginella moellendorffii]|nr:U-box domain-containing protein 43 [Selaginella moellendorffii]|eukprot:XP_002964462.2 U-box domain-containing protein 43 [Selaginella moellendorffii]